MKKNALGRTGLAVSRLGLGGLFVSSIGGEFERARRAVHRAVELGVNYIDTAPTYADSEKVLGRCLEDVSEPLVLSTKLGGRPQPFDPRDKGCLMRSVEESLRLLKRDRIDILMIHEPDRPGQYDWWTDRESFDGPVVEVLDQLKKEGVIRSTGLGGTTAYELARLIRTGRFDVVLTAFNYSLLWREAEHAVLPAAKEHGLGVIVGSPLQQGALARRVGISQAQISRLENGLQGFRSGTLMKIAKALGKPPFYLLMNDRQWEAYERGGGRYSQPVP